jgi:uncharacterized protein (DUF2267 family)
MPRRRIEGSMDHESFVRIVEDALGTSRDDAERAVQATLQTLAERLDRGEARDLAAELPPQIAAWLATAGPAERFDVDEFVARVAAREGTDLATAEAHARAVFVALGQAVSAGELDDMAAQLSSDYRWLLPRGDHVDVTTAEAFWQRVAERAGLDADGARRAAAAVLETLAERIAGGEIDDLIDRLPIALHAPLKRGRERSGGRATAMGFEDFVRRVAEREGVEASQARAHTRAVILTLREAIGDEEFFDVTVQLPDEYVAALAP